jgi:hypothetical protein
VLLLKECLLFISLSAQSGNFWINPRTSCNPVHSQTVLMQWLYTFHTKRKQVLAVISDAFFSPHYLIWISSTWRLKCSILIVYRSTKCLTLTYFHVSVWEYNLIPVFAFSQSFVIHGSYCPLVTCYFVRCWRRWISGGKKKQFGAHTHTHTHTHMYKTLSDLHFA